MNNPSPAPQKRASPTTLVGQGLPGKLGAVPLATMNSQPIGELLEAAIQPKASGVPE